MKKKLKKWINFKKNDKYIQIAKKINIKSRSFFKLKEIQKKYNIINKKNNILELGCYPGGWTQFIYNTIKNTGKIFNCDIYTPTNKQKNIYFIKGNICNKNILTKIIKKTKKYEIHNILSDIAPNITGISEIDVPNYKNIIISILYLCKKKLKLNGNLITKTFTGTTFGFLIKKIKYLFNTLKIFKPQSSNTSSKEIYVIALKYKYKK